MAKLSQRKVSRKNNKKVSRKNRKNKSLTKTQNGGKLLGGTNLVNVCLEACKIMAPMVKEIYAIIYEVDSPDKDGKGAFTIADGIVQYLLEKYLFQDLFLAIVGEESAKVVIEGDNYSVTGDGDVNYDVPKKLYGIIDTARVQIETLKKRLVKSGEDVFNYTDKYVFIDPIDGSTEFKTKLGGESTICIGFSDSQNNNKPFAGIVYRPITDEYALGCKSENCFDSKFNAQKRVETYEPSPKMSKSYNNRTKLLDRYKQKLLTSRKDSEMSKYLLNFFKNGWSRESSGGAGNKMLMLLEGKATAYIQDRGLSRWDTCAAQAVIEAKGGICCKLTDFIGGEDASDGKIESYQYKESKDVNTDFTFYNGEMPSFTPYNINEVVKGKLGITKDNLNSKVESGELTVDIKNFNPYSNLCGIVAYLDPSKETDIRSACKAMAKLSKPVYN